MMIKNLAAFVYFSVLLITSDVRAQFNYTPISDPNGAEGTWVEGISGNIIVGYYQDNKGKYHGFSYNGIAYKTLNDPLGTGFQGTQAYGISGSNIVGFYQASNGVMHGFELNGTTYTPLDDPSAAPAGTLASGISGSTIVGSYFDSDSHLHGYSYDGTNYNTIDEPDGVDGTQAHGVSGGKVAGLFQGGSDTEGFTYDGNAFTSLSFPESVSGQTTLSPLGTQALGIDGNNVVGEVQADAVTNNGQGIQIVGEQFGFLYDGNSYTVLSDPLAENSGGFGTTATGISGNMVVGFYSPSIGGPVTGFEVSVPEPTFPAIFCIFSIGALACRRRISIAD